MAEIQFERRGTPLWKVVLGLLVAGAAVFGGYELLDRDAPASGAPAATVPAATAPVGPSPSATAPVTAPATTTPATPAPGAAGARPQPPAGARPSPRPTTAGTP